MLRRAGREGRGGSRPGLDVDLEPGKRYRAHMPEHGGLIEVTYLGVAPSIVIPEGGGQDLLIPNARVQMPDGTEGMVIEAVLSELDLSS
jgi:hypothetical protein